VARIRGICSAFAASAQQEQAGTRAVGEMPLARTILPKGDSFHVPEKKEHVRYVSHYGSSLPVGGSEKPAVRFIQDQVGK
jgi:hypothetical protein